MTEITFSNMPELLRVFDPKIVRASAAAAATRTAANAKTEISKRIRFGPDGYNVSAKGVSESVRIVKTGLVDRVLLYTGKRISLVHFSSSKRMVNKRPGVSVKIKKRGKRVVVKGAFLANKQIYKRIGKARLPIKKLTGPAVAQMVRNPETLTYISKFVADKMEERFQHEMDRRMQKAAGLI